MTWIWRANLPPAGNRSSLLTLALPKSDTLSIGREFRSEKRLERWASKSSDLKNNPLKNYRLILAGPVVCQPKTDLPRLSASRQCVWTERNWKRNGWANLDEFSCMHIDYLNYHLYYNKYNNYIKILSARATCSRPASTTDFSPTLRKPSSSSGLACSRMSKFLWERRDKW